MKQLGIVNYQLHKKVIVLERFYCCKYVPHVVNSPTVAFSKRDKQRLVLDCRYDMEHVHLFKVKFEDIQIAKMLFDNFFSIFNVRFDISISLY